MGQAEDMAAHVAKEMEAAKARYRGARTQDERNRAEADMMGLEAVHARFKREMMAPKKEQ